MDTLPASCVKADPRPCTPFLPPITVLWLALILAAVVALAWGLL